MPVTDKPTPLEGSHAQILQTLQTYLDAIYDGDVAALRSTFHPDAHLFAEVRGEIVQKTLAAYLQAVGERESPAARNAPYGMSILSVEVLGKIASAKVRVQLGENNYYNFLSLLKIGCDWLIVNKLYSHLEP